MGPPSLDETVILHHYLALRLHQDPSRSLSVSVAGSYRRGDEPE